MFLINVFGLLVMCILLIVSQIGRRGWAIGVIVGSKVSVICSLLIFCQLKY